MRRKNSPRRAVYALFAAVLLLAAPAPGLAQQRGLDLSLPVDALEVEQRLDFLEQRLEDAQTYGRVWQYGWLGVYTASLVTNGVDAGTTDDDDGRVASIVNAAKSSIGIWRMLARPLPTRLGADPIQAMPGGTPERELARLRAAEALLEESARRARRKYSLRPHLASALVNLAGGGIIWGLGDWEDAAVSTGVGILLGELRLWTLPNQPYRDLADYRARYGPLPAPADAGWSIEPRPNGLALTLRF